MSAPPHGLLGGMARAAPKRSPKRQAPLAGWTPRAAPASPHEHGLKMTGLALLITRRSSDRHGTSDQTWVLPKSNTGASESNTVASQVKHGRFPIKHGRFPNKNERLQNKHGASESNTALPNQTRSLPKSNTCASQLKKGASKSNQAQRTSQSNTGTAQSNTGTSQSHKAVLAFEPGATPSPRCARRG